MTLKSRLGLSTIAAICLAGVAAMPAHAGIITSLDSVVQNANGTYSYTYGAILTRGSELQGTQTDFGSSNTSHPVAEFATVYDFGPLVSGTSVTFGSASSVLATLFTFSFENVSNPQSLNTTVPDSPTLANIRFTYNAPTTLVYNAADTATPLNGTTTAIAVSGTDNLGTFTVVSAYAPGAANNLSYDSSTYNSDNYTPQGNNGLINGPAVVNAVPEPASLAVLGMGLVGLGVARRRKMI